MGDGISCFAQHEAPSPYQLVQPNGPIPTAFTTSFFEKFRQETQALTDQADPLIQEKEAFLEASNYYINELLHSGMVLFNDPFSNYVNQIADTLLADQPKVRQQLQLFVIKSPLINAFTTNDGIILIHMGLLAQVKNEAELAFIICHEISHYLAQDGLNIYLNKQLNEKKATNWFGRERLGTLIANQHYYSQQIEEIADKNGLELFLNSSYHPQAAKTVFSLLTQSQPTFGKHPFHPKALYADLPEVRQPTDLANLPSQRPTYVAQSEKPLTHPAPIDRQQIIADLLSEKNAKPSGNLSLIAKDTHTFKAIQLRARYECCHYLVANRQYAQAIYEAQGLLALAPQDTFLAEIIRHSLYGLACYRSAGKFWSIYPDYQEAKGPYQEALYFFESLAPEDLLLLAILQHDLGYPSPQHQDRLQDLVKRWILQYVPDLTKSKGISTYFPPKILVGASSLKKDFFQFVKKDTAIFNLLENTRKKLLIQFHQSNQFQANASDFSGALSQLDPSPKSFVVVEPSFQIWDERTDDPIQYRKSVAYELKAISLIRQYASEKNLSYTLLRSKQLSPHEIEPFRDATLLKNWLIESTQHEELMLVPFYHDAVQELVKKYQTSYFIWLSGIQSSQVRRAKPLVLVAGFIVPPMLPYSLYYALTPRQSLFLYPIVLDLTRETVVPNYAKWINMKAGEDLLHAYIYDLIAQLGTATTHTHANKP